MRSSTQEDKTMTPDDPRVIAAVEEYMSALEAGEHPNRAAFLARHADVANVLAGCLEGLQFMCAARPELDESDAAQADPAGAAPLGDFRIIREVGRGGMGIVYEAEQLSLGRRVALKVLPFAATLDQKQIQRFKNEASAAGQLHHNHIVAVHFVGCERGVHFYAMQFIDGQSLAEVIADLRLRNTELKNEKSDPSPRSLNLQSTINNQKSSTLPSGPSKAFFHALARLGIDAALALEHAHELGVVHRDIKPSNLMLDARGHLWVTDFGLAQIQGDNKLTMTGDLLGTLRYMSPEQALAKRVIVDQRTDVYSLGATLYELMTLQPVFAGNDRQELLRQIAFEDPKPPRRINKAIPPELETIVLKALEKNPAERYPSAKELADDLERFAKDEPIRARRPSLVSLARKWGRRHQSLVWSATAAMIVVALVLASSMGWVARDKAVRQATIQTEVQRALKEVQRLQDQANWSQALEIARQAQMLLESGSSEEAFRQKVRERVSDLRLILRLEQIRLSHSVGITGGTNRKKERVYVDTEYSKAFREYGLDVDKVPPEEAVAIIQAKSVRLELALALDIWARVRRLEKKNDEGWKRLHTIVRVADPDEWRNRFRRVWESDDEKELRASLEKLAATVNVDELLPESIVLLALALRDADRLEQAITLLQKAQRRYFGNFLTNQELAVMLTQTSPPRYDEAFRYFWASVAIRPDYAMSRIDLGNAFRGKGELDEAITYYSDATRLEPDNAGFYRTLGIAQRKQGNLAQAERAFRKAIELDPDDAIAHFELGWFLGVQGKIVQAEESVREAIKISPDYYAAFTELGIDLRKKGKFKDAAEAFRRAVDLKPDIVVHHVNLGIAYSDLGELILAEQAYRKAIKMDVSYTPAYGNLGHLLGKQKKYKEAEEVLREAIKIKSNYFAYNELGGVLGDQDKYKEAEEAYRNAIACAPSDGYDGYAHINLVFNLREQDKLSEIEQVFRKDIDVFERVLKETRSQFGPAHQLTRTARDALIDGYTLLGRQAEARKLREESLGIMKAKVGSGDGLRNFVRAWLVLSEPLSYEGRDGAKALAQQQVPESALLRPRAGESVQAGDKKLLWKEHNSKDVVLDFMTLYGLKSDYKVTYAVCYVHVESDRDDLALRIGSDDQAMVSINGKKVYRHEEARALELDQDEVKPITLRKGSNVVVFKVVNQNGNWEGSLHFVGLDGRPAEGLRFGVEPE